MLTLCLTKDALSSEDHVRELKIHPAAEVFPLMEGEEFDALVKDIEDHGQREPIVLLEGAILDGRNRYRALLQLKIEPRVVHWNSDGSPEAYVVSKNIMRRHLNAGQRAMLIAKFISAYPGRKPHKQAKSKPSDDVQDVNIEDNLNVRDAASMIKVSIGTVSEAGLVQREGTPEEVAEVISGKATVGNTADNIRTRKKAKINTKTEANEARIQTMRMRANIWADLKAGLTHLTALPEPVEVVRIARYSDKQNIVDSKLSLAMEWLKGFADEWNRDRDA